MNGSFFKNNHEIFILSATDFIKKVQLLKNIKNSFGKVGKFPFLRLFLYP